MKHPNESTIQTNICTYLSLIAHTTGIVYFSVPNEGIMTVLMAFKIDKITCFKIVKHFKKLGLLPGTNDLVLVHMGMYYGLEVKTAVGVQSPEQVRFMDNVRKAGGKYEVVRGIEDVQEILKEWGIL